AWWVGGTRGGERGKKEVEAGQPAGKGGAPPAAPDRRSLQADRGADEVPRADEDADQFGDRDGRHAEIMAPQAERRHADDDRETETDENAGGDAPERGQAPRRRKKQRRGSA